MKRFLLYPLTTALVAVAPLTTAAASPGSTSAAAAYGESATATDRVSDSSEPSMPIERRVATPAGELRVRTAGRGNTPLLLWHALYADPSMFDALVAELAPDYRLMLVSAPGHGASGLPDGPLTSAASGAAVLAVLDAYGIDRAAVVGCSWGGIAALQAALQAPRRISAVGAFNTPFGPGDADFGTRAIVWMTGLIGNTEFFGRRVASGFFSQHVRSQQPEVVDRFVAGFVGRDPRLLQMAARAVLLERESLLPLLPRITVPVLVVSGAEDTRYPASEAEAIARGIASARFVRVTDSAHLTPLEQPVISAGLIRDLVPPHQPPAAQADPARP